MQITIKNNQYSIGHGKTEEEAAAQLYAKARHKYIVEGKELTWRPENKKRSVPIKVHNLHSSNEEDLNEPTAKKQEIKETAVVAPITYISLTLAQ